MLFDNYYLDSCAVWCYSGAGYCYVTLQYYIEGRKAKHPMYKFYNFYGFLAEGVIRHLNKFLIHSKTLHVHMLLKSAFFDLLHIVLL